MPAKPTHAIDASALIAYLKNEPGSDQFAELLLDERNVLVMHIVNLWEVHYNYLRADGLVSAEEAWIKANQILGIIDKVETDFMKRASRWKVNHNLGVGDAFAAATAEEYACPLVTTDHRDFEPVERSGALQILWLR